MDDELESESETKSKSKTKTKTDTDTDVVTECIKDLIRLKIKNHKNPYLKCFVLDRGEGMDFNDRNIQCAVSQACDSLMHELEFRFKVVFGPEYCMFRAYKLHLDNEYERVRRYNNYARFASFLDAP